MSFVICAVGFSNGVHCPHAGQWLLHYDVDAFDGQGWCDFTDKIMQAKRFDTFEEAMACWNQQSTVKPLRPDGRPNKPLTALTILVERFVPQ